MADPQPPWTARTGEAAPDLVTYGESTTPDQALVDVDLAGSIAHVAGLHDAELLTTEQATTLVEGLQTLAEQHAEDGLALDPALEDVHMNVEHLLADEIGDAADLLHTARSRNDQVALDLALVTRHGLAEIAQATHTLASALADLAHDHVATPWPVHTHGLPGQPATLGYLLHAHALRLARSTANAMDLFDALDESPLGAAAGAGTTLPIDPVVPAELLGLQPPANGLLATGARDGSIQATQLAAHVGHQLQDLAVDLLALAEQDAIALPDAYTTGSSIMPHKQNPDALELARADGAKLATLADQVQQITAGLGLGYDRDLQRAKPPLLEATSLAPQTASILAGVVDGLTVHEDALAALQDDPAVATTDAVEALVDQGVAFRQAHQLVSEACQQAATSDVPIETALEDAELPPDVHAATLAALDPDPGRRELPGGPAPTTVDEALTDLGDELDTLEARVAATVDAAAAPHQLLSLPASKLLAQAEGSP